MRQNVSRAYAHFVVCRGLLFLLFEQYKNFFQLAQIGGRFDLDIQEQVFAVHHLRHRTDGQAFGKDLVSAAGQHGFTDRNLLVGSSRVPE